MGGALLAVALAALITLVNRAMPFISMSELPAEIMSRTRPTPLDLGIALAGGLAAAYALTRPSLSAALPGVAIATALMPPLCTIGAGLALGRMDVALGAGLLFLTNAVAIAFASALVFLIRGLNPTYILGRGQLPRSLVISAVLTLVLLVPLSYFSIRFIAEANQNRLIENVVREQIGRDPFSRTVRYFHHPPAEAWRIQVRAQAKTPRGANPAGFFVSRCCVFPAGATSSHPWRPVRSPA